jgi:HAD superfamily hydrolase (TIGR01549 family)
MDHANFPLRTIREAYSHVDFFLWQEPSLHHGPSYKKDFMRKYNEYLSIYLQVHRNYETFNDLMQEYFTKYRCRVLFPEVHYVLKTLRRKGYPLFILANWEANLRELCAALKIDHFFQGIYASELMDSDKPNPAIFRQFIELSNVEAAKAVYVGDNYMHDVIPSRRCGFQPILVMRKKRIEGDCIRIENLKGLLKYLNIE